MNVLLRRSLSQRELQLLQQNDDVLEVVRKVLEFKLTQTPEVPDYSNPAWPYHQAHLNGEREALRDCVKLLILEKE